MVKSLDPPRRMGLALQGCANLASPDLPRRPHLASGSEPAPREPRSHPARLAASPKVRLHLASPEPALNLDALRPPMNKICQPSLSFSLIIVVACASVSGSEEVLKCAKERMYSSQEDVTIITACENTCEANCRQVSGRNNAIPLGWP